MKVDDVSEIRELFLEFMDKVYKKELGEAISKGENFLIIDFQNMDKFNQELGNLLIDYPNKIIEVFEDSLQKEHGFKSFYVRFSNLPDSCLVRISNIRKKHLEKFLYIEGIVRQSSDVRPMCTLIIYKCLQCEQKISIPQEMKIIKKPKRCPHCGKRGPFEEEKKKLVDTQRLIIEECPENLEGGNQPRRINIFLRNDLVDPSIVKKSSPGSKVRIVGVVHSFAKRIPAQRAKSTLFDLYVEANFIKPIQQDFDDINITEEDIEEIELLSQDPQIFDKFVRSVAPTIKGRNYIKQAMILQMFGGVRKERGDGTATRGDIHVLLIGDPGTGKSQLVKSMGSVCPKARYVSGKGTTGAGLTATVVRDDFLRGWALEAGALVLAHKGLLCVDEIDKMSDEDRSAMHEAMEQQQVSISKANVQAVLNCQTTLLAAANPEYGRFDSYKPISEQIDMPVTLISRFDLIFPVRDIPDRAKDTELAEHMLKGHKEPDSHQPMIPYEFIRKYVSYAKKNIRPKLTNKAIKYIKDFFVNLRNKEILSADDSRPVPITPRQLEAMVRLAEANARLHLRKKVLKEDAKRSISLMKNYLHRLGVDPDTGEIDIDRVVSGVTSSQRSKIHEMFEIIKELESAFGGNIPIEEIIKEAESRGIEDMKAKETIDKMKRAGEIFEPRPGIFRRTNSK